MQHDPNFTKLLDWQKNLELKKKYFHLRFPQHHAANSIF